MKVCLTRCLPGGCCVGVLVPVDSFVDELDSLRRLVIGETYVDSEQSDFDYRLVGLVKLVDLSEDVDDLSLWHCKVLEVPLGDLWGHCCGNRCTRNCCQKNSGCPDTQRSQKITKKPLSTYVH